MADFKVTASQLNTQAESLQDLNGRFKSAIEQLVTSETSLKSMWEGEANDAFHAAFTSDKAKMDEFYNLIITYIERLNSIATRYEQTENKHRNCKQQNILITTKNKGVHYYDRNN